MDLQYFKSKLTKRQIEELATMDAEKILMSGEENPLDVQIYFKKVKAYTDKFLEKNEPAAMDEYHKHSKKLVEIGGVKVQHIQGGLIPDYEKDPVYLDLKEQLRIRKEELDHAFRTKKEYARAEDGVIAPVLPVKTHKKDSLTVTL